MVQPQFKTVLCEFIRNVLKFQTGEINYRISLLASVDELIRLINNNHLGRIGEANLADLRLISETIGSSRENVQLLTRLKELLEENAPPVVAEGRHEGSAQQDLPQQARAVEERDELNGHDGLNGGQNGRDLDAGGHMEVEILGAVDNIVDVVDVLDVVDDLAADVDVVHAVDDLLIEVDGPLNDDALNAVIQHAIDPDQDERDDAH